MAYEKLTIVKRSGAQEPFALGRIAMAVYKAACAQDPPLPQARARLLGGQIAQKIERLARDGAAGGPRVDQEWIQDRVVEQIAESGEEALAISYQEYREERRRERLGERAQKEKEKRWRFSEGAARVEVSLSEWMSLLDQALERGPRGEWNSEKWWESSQERASSAPSYARFIGAHIEALLTHCQGRESWLGAASALLLERWSKASLGAGLLSDGSEAANARLRALAREKILAMQPKRGWFPEAAELDGLIEKLDLAKEARLGFQGLCLLERALPALGGGAELPGVAFIRASVALARGDRATDGDHAGRARFMASVFDELYAARVLLPLSSLKSALAPDQCFTHEWALGVEDDLESIFEALKQTAMAGKSGGSVSVDLTRLRAEGRPIGEGAKKSAGLRPVLALFGETCGMLEASPGERQKARLFLEPWHADLETFLAYGKIAPSEVRLGISLPDAFMKRVIEGGDWALCSPTEAPKLAVTGGAEFEGWMREYAQMAKAGGLGRSRRVDAREVFDWICESIRSTGGPSIAFKDQLEIFGAGPKVRGALSARMSLLLPALPRERAGAPEAAVNAALIGGDEEGLRVCELALRALRSAGEQDCARAGEAMAWCAANRPVALTAVGEVEPERFASWAMGAAQRLGSGIWAKDALWNERRPWRERRRRLMERRGGMLEPMSGLDPTERAGPPVPFATLIAISAREEYLWLSGQSPSFVEPGSYRPQARFGQSKAVFGEPGEGQSVKRQAQLAAAWQAHCDQGMTWDARVDRLSAELIGEAIKLAWLQGLSGVRRFLGPAEGSAD